MANTQAKKHSRYPIDWTSPGRMISGSKIGPEGHVCVWNANVCVKSKGKVWWGDLDLTDDADDLKRLASEQGETVYVLHEHDGRFLNEAKPLYARARATVAPDGTLQIHERQF